MSGLSLSICICEIVKYGAYYYYNQGKDPEMNNSWREVINPEFVEFEGMLYLEYKGEFYKGCKRCGGYGNYSHNGEHSRCYSCDNTSAKLGEHIGSDRKVAEKWCHVRALAKANRERKAEEARLAEVRKMEAKQEALKASDPDVFEFLMSVAHEGPQQEDYSSYDSFYDAISEFSRSGKGERSSFIKAMAESLVYVSQASKPFSDKMIAAVRKTIDERAAKKAAKATGPKVAEGRLSVSGRVVSTKSYETDYGTSYKMLVELEDGTRIFGSIPSNIWDEVEFLGAYRKLAWNETDGVMTKLVGVVLKFTATIEASKDDVSFGFFKRPAKAEIVAEEVE